jgi:hypothetical protein
VVCCGYRTREPQIEREGETREKREGGERGCVTDVCPRRAAADPTTKRFSVSLRGEKKKKKTVPRFFYNPPIARAKLSKGNHDMGKAKRPFPSRGTSQGGGGCARGTTTAAVKRRVKQTTFDGALTKHTPRRAPVIEPADRRNDLDDDRLRHRGQALRLHALRLPALVRRHGVRVGCDVCVCVLTCVVAACGAF